METKPLKQASWTFLVCLAAALLSVALPASAQCGGGQGGAPTLTTIAVDGASTDWASVLSNSLQVTNDGQFSAACNIAPLDRDCSLNKNVSGRDLARFAWTYDSTYIYVYQARFGSASNTQAFYFYMDTNSNQRMNTGEKVFQIRFSGQTRKTDGYLYNYTAAGGAAGDGMVNGSGFADGYTMPGTLGNEVALFSNVTAGWSDGTGFEGRVAWTNLGVPAGTAVYFHVSSCNTANPGQVPASIDDNLGGPGGGLGAFAFQLVDLSPDRSSTTAPGSSTAVDYLHTLTNSGTLPDRYDFVATSSAAFQVDLYDAGTDTWMGTDLQGDGVWDSVNPAYDGPTADGRPDSPALDPAGTLALRLHLTAPSGTQNAFDTTVLRAVSQSTPTCVFDTATDATAVGALTLLPTPQSKVGVAGQVVDFGLTLSNHSLADTFNLTPLSSAAYRVDLFTDPDGDGDPADGLLVASDLNGNGVFTDSGDSITAGYDTDSDGRPDFGEMAYGAAQPFVIRLALPSGATLDSTSTVGLQALGADSGAVATGTLSATVKERLTLTPSYTLAGGTGKYSGENRSVFYAHTLLNGWPAADSVTLSAASDHAWVVRLLTDPNGDGNPNDGVPIAAAVPLPANGGALHFIAEVVIPSGLTFPVTDTTTVTATSGLAPSISANATDQVRVSYLAVYADLNHSVAGTCFVRCDTVYVLGSSLSPNAATRYQVRYLDPSAGVIRSVTIPSDGNGEAPDSYTFTASDPRGTWTLELWDGATRIDTVPVILDPLATPSTIQPVAFNRASYALSGDTLTATATFNNTSLGGTYTGTAFHYTVLNAAGDRYLTAAGTFAAYSVGLYTRTTSPHTVTPGAALSETVSVPSVTFDGPGVYRLVVDWVGPCANTIATTTVPFPVGTGIASYSDAAASQPSDLFGPAATLYLNGANFLPGAPYTVAYYGPDGSLVATQALTANGGGTLATSIPVSSLSGDGLWHAVVYPSGTSPLPTYSEAYGGALAEDGFSVDTAPPAAPVVTAPSDGSDVTDTTPTLSGTAEPGSSVAVFLDGVQIGTVTADGAGDWSYTPPTDLGYGSHTVAATATDAAGNTSAASATLGFDLVHLAPVVGGPVTPMTGSLSGLSSAPDGTVITVYENAVPIGTTTVSGGTWTLTGFPPLTPGATVTATAGTGQAMSAPSAGVVVSVLLLRNAEITQLAPQTPPSSALFETPFLGASLNLVDDLEKAVFPSGDTFPHEVSDLDAGASPLIFYQVAGEDADTLRVTISGGKIVITH